MVLLVLIFQGLAIALITGLGVQVLLGMFAHWYKRTSGDSASSPGRGAFHFAHIGLGLVVVMLGWATSLTGMSNGQTYGPFRLTFRIRPAMGRRIWGRAGSICHWMESSIGSLYRGELETSSPLSYTDR